MSSPRRPVSPILNKQALTAARRKLQSVHGYRLAGPWPPPEADQLLLDTATIGLSLIRHIECEDRVLKLPAVLDLPAGDAALPSDSPSAAVMHVPEPHGEQGFRDTKEESGVWIQASFIEEHMAELSSGELACYLVTALHGGVVVPQSKLASLTGRSQSRAGHARRLLLERGLISVTHVPGRYNTYSLLPLEACKRASQRLEIVM